MEGVHFYMRITFDAWIAQKELMILDGAMATELEAKGYDLNDSLWSAKVLANTPQAIKDVHYDYFVHGADAGISASYQASMQGFMEKGYSKEKAKEMIELSMKLLLDAREEWWRAEGEKKGRAFPIAIASIGPFGAYLADGSEYSGDYKISKEALKEFHRVRMDILKEAGAELFALETFPNLQEAVVCAELMEERKADYYISFSFKNSKQINAGNTIEECVKQLKDFPHLKAIGVNCTLPGFVKDIITEYKTYTNLPIVVYPNSGELFNAEKKNCYVKRLFDSFEKWSKDWYQAGATLIGGCCRTTPDDIAHIYQWYEKQRKEK